MTYLTRLEVKMKKECVCESSTIRGKRIRESNDAAAIMRETLDADRERLVCLHLDANLSIIGFEIVSIGTLSATLINPREIFKAAILMNSNKIMLLHNHPSGDCSPSAEDIEVTRKVKEGGDLLGIELLDHVILGAGESFMSFADKGML
jgi:DNA repair protein RadC